MGNNDYNKETLPCFLLSLFYTTWLHSACFLSVILFKGLHKELIKWQTKVLYPGSILQQKYIYIRLPKKPNMKLIDKKEQRKQPWFTLQSCASQPKPTKAITTFLE